MRRNSRSAQIVGQGRHNSHDDHRDRLFAILQIELYQAYDDQSNGCGTYKSEK